MVAGPSDESFLPQIVGVFYAVFDPHRGPIVPYQVPETLISQPEDLGKSHLINPTNRRPSPTPPSGTPARSHSSSPTRAPSTFSKRALSVSPSRMFRSASRRSPSPLAQSTSSLPYNPKPLISPAMIDFPSIAEYIIPKSPLKHRLITCCSGRYKILGFPCLIEDASYERNEFIFNIAFVFDRLSDLSAFEPVVRKCGRIMRAAELDTRWLSTKTAQPKIQSVLEQLHEDLNSYSATSIVLDGINSLDLTLFPFYANPPPVHDWHVPVALIDFQKLKDANWDITASKICQYIDGVQHVERIAQLADADLDSVRSCIQHFLYYQVIMMIDIFQYSNMYTCKPAIQRKIKDRGVSEECGLYVTQAGFPIPSWPVLAILYSQLRPGITVHEWMEANQVRQRGIDVRRFVTFGIIKGFLRRVHRWPIYVDTVTGAGVRDPSRPRSNERARIGNIDEEVTMVGTGASLGSASATVGRMTSGLGMLRLGEESKRKDSMATTSGTAGGTTGGGGTSTMGKNESSITLRTTTTSTTGSLGTSPTTGGGIWRARSDSPTPGGFMQVTPMSIATNGHPHHHQSNSNNPPSGNRQSKSPGYFQPQAPMLSSSLRSNQGIGIISTSHTTNQSFPRVGGAGGGAVGGGGGGSQTSIQTGFLGPGGRPLGHQRHSRDARTRGRLRTPGGAGPNQAAVTQQEQETHLHASMLGYLDGLHHADELQVKFKMGWTKLEECLKKIAGLPVGLGADGRDDDDPAGLSKEKKESIERGDFGKIVIVLR